MRDIIIGLIEVGTVCVNVVDHLLLLSDHVEGRVPATLDQVAELVHGFNEQQVVFAQHAGDAHRSDLLDDVV
eukprot:CAMPEP_0116899616 /NCGR_PEP_ID=MMETSP0467-20121206/8129_1 /TAXON_ID=283647 /ORGANISM="Mesodinium pulex, Strain SPMC105" /LENGTH=71 /DNA_ID=CAMNT_0004572503 /DNA_START=176 /DNA_END=391 /DNA_ORIENTATION=-